MRTTLAIIALLVACSAPPPPTPTPTPSPVLTTFPPTAPRIDSPSEMLAASDTLTAFAAEAAPAAVVRGNWRIFHGPTSCHPVGGVNPGIRVATKEPRVGRHVEVHWTNRAAPPWPQAPTLLFFSLRPLAVPVDISTTWRADGCHLLVHPDYLMVPVSGTGPGDGGTLWHQSQATTIMRWAAGPEFTGRTVYCQLLVQAVGENDGGWILSPGLEITFGSAL